MPEEVGNLILERLRRLDARLERIEEDISDGKTRMLAMEEHLGGLFIAITGISTRLERVETRLSRVERRLEIQGAGG